MASNKGKEGDLKFHDNQPYDVEIDIEHEENEDDEDQEEKGDDPRRMNQNLQMNPEDDDRPNYQEIKAAEKTSPMAALPRFDMNKLQALQSTPEIKELFIIMQR